MEPTQLVEKQLPADLNDRPRQGNGREGKKLRAFEPGVGAHAEDGEIHPTVASGTLIFSLDVLRVLLLVLPQIGCTGEYEHRGSCVSDRQQLTSAGAYGVGHGVYMDCCVMTSW